MSIAIDASHAYDRSPTGVAVYSRRLIEELLAITPETRFLLALRANRFARALRGEKLGANARRVLLEAAATPLWAGGVELFHGLNQRLPEREFPRRVSTFHDLFVMTAEYSTPDFRARFSEQAREAATRSDRLIAVSAYTADQAARLLGSPRERIAVIPHGVDFPAPRSAEQDAETVERMGLRSPFLLSVGAIQKRKNTERLVEAFGGLSGEPMLALAGGHGYGSEEILARIERSPARDRIRLLGYVDDDERQALYGRAAALAFPSLDEGFGIPVLEAMAAGLPVVTSDRSALPEAAGEAAVLVDPESTTEIRAGLDRVLTEESLRKQLIATGLERAKSFTWRRAAEATWAVYRDLL